MMPLHLDVGGAGAASVEWADALLAAAVLFAASGVPFAVGLWSAGRWRGAPALLAGFAAGAVFLLALDLFKESGVGAGLLRPTTTVLLLAAFALGAALPAFLARRATWAPAGGVGVPAFLWALGVGAHGVGEGYVVGTEAHTALFALPFFGGLSFVLHKVIEGATVRPFQDAPAAPRGVFALTLAAALPSAAGALLGAALGPTRFANVAFAVGAGAGLWALLTLARRGDGSPRYYAAVVLGAVAVYGAGLLHEL